MSVGQVVLTCRRSLTPWDPGRDAVVLELAPLLSKAGAQSIRLNLVA